MQHLAVMNMTFDYGNLQSQYINLNMLRDKDPLYIHQRHNTLSGSNLITNMAYTAGCFLKRKKNTCLLLKMIVTIFSRTHNQLATCKETHTHTRNFVALV